MTQQSPQTDDLRELAARILARNKAQKRAKTPPSCVVAVYSNATAQLSPSAAQPPRNSDATNSLKSTDSLALERTDERNQSATNELRWGATRGVKKEPNATSKYADYFNSGKAGVAAEDDEQEALEERIAIMEMDGGLSRVEAEAALLACSNGARRVHALVSCRVRSNREFG